MFNILEENLNFQDAMMRVGFDNASVRRSDMNFYLTGEKPETLISPVRPVAPVLFAVYPSGVEEQYIISQVDYDANDWEVVTL